ncbi:rhomboid family intramembrane serine protease [Acaricomes phytoseiuli]|uniref:rhomboid family intramembrane serine protease n=1 Tax=Acaricomes phytoseiuli TaxID=291968 RepID=UPI000399C1AC|nr:rhomboid family intramembrane serine protease [Acaricomes phytoseiuli]
MPKQRTAFGAVAREGRPVVTFTLIAICVVVFVFEWVPGLNLQNTLMYAPFLTELQPWRMLTSVFAHSTSFLGHILFNMWALYVLGQALEPVLGRLRFLALFLVSGFAGSVAVLLIAPVDQGVVGASGAVFGLFGAVLVLQLKQRANLTPILVVLGINAVLGFMIPGIAWQAHLGGLIAGALLGLIFIYAPAGRQVYQWAGLAVIMLILLALTVWRAAVLHDFLFTPVLG